MQKTALIILCVALAILSAVLAYKLYDQSRFTRASSTNPYLMFDRKTAQACWSGPPSTTLPPGGSIWEGPNTNAANLPFCKDLK
jgi:hypothetical protein